MLFWLNNAIFEPSKIKPVRVQFLADKLFQALHDESKDDADSIHSFDLNESVSRMVSNVIDGFHDFTQDDLRNVWIKTMTSD